MLEKEKTCFFTGHRNLPKHQAGQVHDILKKQILFLYENYKVDTFISGGALGFDLLAAKTVLLLKETIPELKLLVYLPCYGQEKFWSDPQRYQFRLILSKADQYRYISPEPYTKDCMKKRNYKMVNDSSFGIAYYILSRSGTGQTIRYAQSHCVSVYNIADELYAENTK